MKKKLAILGCGIGYTLSPTIHTAILNSLGVECEFNVFDVTEGELDSAVSALRDEYDGFFVTKPYKNAVESYLTENHNKGGGVNVVKVDGDNLIGWSTDGAGFLAPLNALKLSFDSALIIGAGGAAQAIIRAVKPLIANVYVVNRDADKLKAVVEGEGVSYYNGEAVELIVNATTPAADNANPLDVFKPNVSAVKCAYEIVYANRVTPFMKSFSDGVTVIGGLSMLIYQAICGEEIILGTPLDKGAIYNELKEKIK